MKMNKQFAAITAAALGMSMLFTACGGSTGSTSSTSAAASSASASAAESAASETAASESEAASASTSGSSQAASDTSSDLNSKSLDDIIAAAKEEGDVESVGMPDNWADWASLWQNLKDITASPIPTRICPLPRNCRCSRQKARMPPRISAM